MASFAGVNFTADFDSYRENREARVTVLDIPGGDIFYVDQAGRGPMTVSVGVLVNDESSWGALHSNIGRQGSLNVDGLTSHQAVLMKCERGKVYANGQTVGSLDFLIVDV